eukprot:scaffold1519_cov99-Isochrysis_galbana.AAC.4
MSHDRVLPRECHGTSHRLEQLAVRYRRRSWEVRAKKVARGQPRRLQLDEGAPGRRQMRGDGQVPSSGAGTAHPRAAGGEKGHAPPGGGSGRKSTRGRGALVLTSGSAGGAATRADVMPNWSRSMSIGSTEKSGTVSSGCGDEDCNGCRGEKLGRVELLATASMGRRRDATSTTSLRTELPAEG